MSRIRLLIADTDGDYRDLVKQLMCEKPDVEVGHDVDDGRELVYKAPKRANAGSGNAVLTAVDLASADGVYAVDRLNRILFERPIELVLNEYSSAFLRREMLISGINSLVTSKHLSRTIESILVEIKKEVSKRMGESDEKEPKKSIADINSVYGYGLCLFKKIGLSMSLSGGRYLLDALTMAYFDDKYVECISKCLYTEVAKMNRTTPECVERTVRSALADLWEKGNHKELEKMFPLKDYPESSRPTNSEFVAAMVTEARLYFLGKDGVFSSPEDKQ